MTDKATVEIPTPVAGSVLALGGAVGDVLAVGAVLIRIEAPGLPDSAVPAAPKLAPQKPEPEPAPTVQSEADEPRRARQPRRLRVRASRRRLRRAKLRRVRARRAWLARGRSLRPLCA